MNTQEKTLVTLGPDTPFVPKTGETYYYPILLRDGFRFESGAYIFVSLTHCGNHVASGLCRRTAEEAQAICDELNAVLDKHQRKAE